MDIISHGLWGGVAFGRKNRKLFLLAFLFGILPDMLSFGILWFLNILGITGGPRFSDGKPDLASIPEYVNSFYNVTHSLIFFLFLFLIVWFFRKKPLWPLAAWGFHILIDIPSHSLDFFATPFLWPISDFRFNGINWGNPIIFIPNLVLLTLAYASWAIYSNMKSRQINKK